MIEERHTAHNPQFTGFCVEFWRDEFLIAVCTLGSPAHEALKIALKPAKQTVAA